MNATHYGSCIAIGTALWLGAASAHAAGFALLEQGTSRLGTAFAGTGAMQGDASVIFFNPAALTALSQAETAFVASGIEISSSFHDQASRASFGQSLGAEGGDAGGWNFVPSAYLAVPLSANVVAGLGVNAPFGLSTEYPRDWIGRFQALESQIKTLNVNPSVAFKIGPVVSIGIGANYQKLQAELSNAVNYSALIAQGVQQLTSNGQLPPSAATGVLAASTGLEGSARLRGDDHGYGYNLGVLFNFAEQTRIGISYRSAIHYEVHGAIAFTAPTITNPVAASIAFAAASSDAPVASGPASVDLTVPDSATISVARRLGSNLELLADVAWTGWSSVQELRVVRNSGVTVSRTPEDWDDTWRYSLGVSYALNRALTLRSGIALDATPVPRSTRTPRLPDAARTLLAVGAQWTLSEAAALDFAFGHVFIRDAAMNQDAGSVAASALLVGSQRSDVDILSTQFTYRF